MGTTHGEMVVPKLLPRNGPRGTYSHFWMSRATGEGTSRADRSRQGHQTSLPSPLDEGADAQLSLAPPLGLQPQRAGCPRTKDRGPLRSSWQAAAKSEMTKGQEKEKYSSVPGGRETYLLQETNSKPRRVCRQILLLLQKFSTPDPKSCVLSVVYKFIICL